jgi:hypothetical protein
LRFLFSASRDEIEASQIALASGGHQVIRQAVSCDICGTEKRLTNHWFVAYDLGGELRVSGWNSRNRSRAEAKHLCGQTCLHKLVDEFITRSLDLPESTSAAAKIGSARIDASLTATASHPTPVAPRPPIYVDEFTPPVSPRKLRADAWQREKRRSIA